jgi:hypothetical protein
MVVMKNPFKETPDQCGVIVYSTAAPQSWTVVGQAAMPLVLRALPSDGCLTLFLTLVTYDLRLESYNRLAVEAWANSMASSTREPSGDGVL